MTRITQGMISNNVLAGLQTNGTRLDQIMTQLSTGKAINQPSDDPVGVTRDLQLHSLTSKYDQYYRNMQDGDAWLSTSDTAMQSGNNVLQSANELAIQGASGTYSAVQRSDLNSQVRSLLDQMLAISNTTLRGQYVFSGTQTDSPPFSLAHGADTITDDIPGANGTSLTTVPATIQLFDTAQSGSKTTTGNPAAYDVIPGTVQISGLTEGTDYTVDYKNGSVTFNTAAATTLASGAGIKVQYDWIQRSEKDLTGSVNRQMQPGSDIKVNINADTAFGSKSQTNVFDSLIDLMQGLHTNSQSQIQSSMSEVQDSLTQLLQAQTTAGSKQNLLQSSESQNRSDALQVTNDTNDVEAIDFTKVASEYQNLQTVYQASIQVAAKIIQPSLANYL
jgi:flagellar hook-associated protein 3 FlgL